MGAAQPDGGERNLAVATVLLRGVPLPVDVRTTTCGALAERLQEQAPAVARETLRLVLPKPSGVVLLQPNAARLLEDVGVRPGSRVLCLGALAAELQQLADAQAQHEALRLPSFEREDLQAAARRRRGADASSSWNTSATHRFSSFEALPAREAPPGAPPPAAALALLERLARDRGIVAAMQKRGWMVGKLSELQQIGSFANEGDVCLLGLNRNRGQEILLRLRTDDGRGFRRYELLRDVLCHELAHNVHGEHDAAFKELWSELRREVAAHDAARGPSHLLGGHGESWLGDAEDGQPPQPGPGQGRTLGTAAGGAGGPPLAPAGLDAREMARRAALARAGQQGQQPEQERGGGPTR